MDDNMTYRMAVSTDAAYVYQALRDTADEQNLLDRFTLTEADVINELFSEKASSEALLVFSKDKPIGLILFSMTNRNFAFFNGPGIYIHDIYVEKDYRRKKIGSEFIKQIKNIAQERRCSRIDWVVLKSNEKALRFYQTISEVKEVDYIHYMRMKVEDNV